MPTFGSYYIDGNNFFQATGVWTNPQLTTCAPEGYYSDGTNVRYLDASCVLGSVTPCPSCYIPCGSDINVDEDNAPGNYRMQFSTGGDVGAMMVYFNPANLPDGIRVTYQSTVYNYYSSARYGKLWDYNTPVIGSGEIMFVGTTGQSGCDGAPGLLPVGLQAAPPAANSTCPAPDCGGQYGPGGMGEVRVYDNATNSFQLSTETTSWFVGASMNKLTPLCPTMCGVVVPILTASADEVVVDVFGCCDNTGWDAKITCPTLLTGISFTGYAATNFTDACNDTSNTGTLYNAPIGTFGGGTNCMVNWNEGTYGSPGINDLMFQGPNGPYGQGNVTFDGFYKYPEGGIDKYIEIIDNVVVSAGNC
ncbi:MAG: hypothetical protein Unbinned1524contig1000_53 [Prokaryotic dsDNA virus sp.]|nr:MAG: hypothetical protein Unbinned1524contig1000_53 [Prokaryotic dsDNA virus sp.]|tara:strand:- start:25243 stop:26328 length:1086 start_codon:yes stop_codon:yes gene_type:complete